MYITIDDLNDNLDTDWADDLTDRQVRRLLLIVNAWLSKQGLPTYEPDDVPEPIKQAGVEIATAYLAGDMYQGRDEGMVVQESVSAGEVSSSRTYKDGNDGRAMSAAEMIALDLIAPFTKPTYRSIAVIRP